MMRSLHFTDFDRIPFHRALEVVALALIVLALTAASAFGGTDQATVDEKEPAEEVVPIVDEDDDKVTMAIDLEEGATIDLEMAHGDVLIDTWDGDEVLVIVEKMSKSTLNSSGVVSPRHINFKVSRQGNNVRIAAMDNQGKRVTDVDFSFRIVVPKDRQSKEIEHVYDLSKLTSVIFKALHREALNWLMR